MTCALCTPDLGPVLAEGSSWRLILNRNQNLLGKCFLVARRHAEAVDELTPGEWQELREQLRAATAALRLLTRPDHFNYAFLQNQDRHVHLHVIPRYAAARQLAGLTFTDPDFPGHYAVPAPDRRLAAAETSELAALLRHALATAASGS